MTLSSPGNHRKQKNVLMIAHAFPPFRSVGHSIRVVKFIKYLPLLNWQPIVLTIDDEKEYEDYFHEGSSSLLSELPKETPIFRTSAGEPSMKYLEKEKKISGRNLVTKFIGKVLGGSRRWVFRNLALPDRRVVWLPYAIIKGQEITKRENVEAIFVTCPPHSATLIGAFLKLLTRKPLILDYRDDWIDTPWHQSRPPIIRKIEQSMEKWVVSTADKVTLVTEWSRKAFIERYSDQPDEKFVLIPNGCDLEEFSELANELPAPQRHKFTIMHTGSLNDSKNWRRSPEALFAAIQTILQQQPEMVAKLSLTFTGTLPERYRQLANKYGIAELVETPGFLPRDQWYAHLKSSDLLLVINYDGFSTLIPGKIYEYWAVGGPPILLLSCPGAAANFVKQHALGFTVDPYDTEGIKQAIQKVYDQKKTGSPARITTRGIDAYDRRFLTEKLARVLWMVTTTDNRV